MHLASRGRTCKAAVGTGDHVLPPRPARKAYNPLCNGTHDEDDTQTANELIANIFDESVYAEEVGLYSAWTGSYRAAGAR